MNNEKVCTRCRLCKPLTDFGRQKGTKDGLRYYCRACRSAEDKRKHLSGEKRAEYRKRLGTRAGQTYALFKNAYSRSQKYGHEFNLTKEWIEQKLRAGVCEASGLPLTTDFSDVDLNERRMRAWGPSLDRIDNTRGYTTDNTKLVCWLYNRAKGVDGHDDVMRLALALAAKAAP